MDHVMPVCRATKLCRPAKTSKAVVCSSILMNSPNAYWGYLLGCVYLACDKIEQSQRLLILAHGGMNKMNSFLREKWTWNMITWAEVNFIFRQISRRSWLPLLCCDGSGGGRRRCDQQVRNHYWLVHESWRNNVVSFVVLPLAIWFCSEHDISWLNDVNNTEDAPYIGMDKKCSEKLLASSSDTFLPTIHF